MPRTKKPVGEVRDGYTSWQNRIVKSGTKPASEFLAHPDNYRTHPSSQESALVSVLDKVGWVQEVVVSARTGYTIDGHLRVLAAMQKGDETPVPFKEVDVSEAEEALLLSVLDPLSALAGFDTAKYNELLTLLPDDMLDMAKAVMPDKTHGIDVSFTAAQRIQVVVDCHDADTAHALSAKLVAEGYQCRVKGA